MILPNDSDYVFDKLRDLERIEPYLYPKIEGNWVIVMMDMRIKELKYILNEMNIPDYVDLVCTVKQDTYKEFCRQYPTYAIEPKTKKEMYEEFIATIDIPIDIKAYYALYNRSRGDINRIREVIDSIMEILPDTNNITVKEVDRVLPRENIVYASDVVLAMLLYKNPVLKKTGSRYSKYKYAKPKKLLWQLIEALGYEYAFYAMRVQVRALYKEVTKYMNNEESKFADLFQIVDVFKITTAYTMFEICNYMQIVTIYKVVIGDEDCDSLFKGTLRQSIEEYNYPRY